VLPRASRDGAILTTRSFPRLLCVFDPNSKNITTASKATLLSAKDIPVPKQKFQESFGESWDTVLKENRACNALEACKRFNCDASELDAAWGKAKKVVKFGGGFYCGLVSMNNKELYVFNAFFMSMRSKFVGTGTSIHCYEVEWSPRKLSWDDFRNKVLGPTDPAEAPVGSLRRTILDDYKSLGLADKPNKGDNGVHASASPFEGLAEKANWLGRSIDSDPFGKVRTVHQYQNHWICRTTRHLLSAVHVSP